MFRGIYRGRRVFVTGHTGFKGTWLALWLSRLGAEVTGFALEPPSEPSLFCELEFDERPPSGLHDCRGDVRDAALLEDALRRAAPEIVFHLAAQPLVRRSYAQPRLTFETNVMGTVNLLEAVRILAARGYGPSVVVNVTSDKCYENQEDRRAYAETDTLGGRDPYSVSKSCSELATIAYRRSFFAAPSAPRLATCRAGNVIGGGDWGADRLLPDCVRALHRGEKILVRRPDAVRPWQHVLESLAGYLTLAARLMDSHAETAYTQGAGAWNFGPRTQDAVTVAHVVERFVTAWGDGGWRHAGVEGEPYEAGLLQLDSRRAEQELGWAPVWEVDTAVTRAAEWYRSWHQGVGATELRERALADIACYEGSAAGAGCSWAAGEAGSA